MIVRPPGIFLAVSILTLTLSVTARGISTALAQTGDADRVENSLRDGSWSVQFRINNDFVLSQFTGTGISLKWHTSRHSAWRAGVDAGLDFSDSDTNGSTSDSDTLIASGGSELDSNGQGFELNLQYLRYPRPDADINLFFGAGPLVNFGRDHRESVSFSTSSSDSVVRRNASTDNFRSWGVGVSGLLGVEWFIMKSLSIHAEYNSSLLLTWSSNERIRQSSTGTVSRSDVDTTRWDVRSGSVKFGLSAYF